MENDKDNDGNEPDSSQRNADSASPTHSTSSNESDTNVTTPLNKTKCAVNFKSYSQKRDAMSTENVEIELENVGKRSCSTRRASRTPAGDAVVIRNAEKSYFKSEPVLKGLNMTVPCGSIYGLLGKSGSGKSTILQSIVGIGKLDHGEIWVFGEKPGTKSVGVPGRNVGYMPQDISLYMEFSIAETLIYFGTLSGMSKEEIIKARKFFLAFLDLPEDTRRVGSLSGGQQRRVSLVAALLSGPELLILDEPTVGVDPLIRQNIWQHLKKLVNSKRTTVIITTHYIEECRSADNIGIMRNGILLEERPPDILMEEHCSNNLEKIVLTLSRRNNGIGQLEERNFNENDIPEEGIYRLKGEEDNFTENIPMAKVLHEPNPGIKDSMKRIRALTGKNFVILLRNPLLLMFVIIIAAAMVVLMCVALGADPKNLNVGLVNHEVENYAECANVTRIEHECSIEMLSCRFLSQLKPGVINLFPYKSKEEALNSVRAADTWGYIYFPAEFSDSFFERMLVSGGDPDELVLNSSEIFVRLDDSNKQISNRIRKTLYDGFEDFIFIMLSDCGYDARQGESTFKYHEPIFGKDTTDFREFLAPAAVLVVVFFFPIITTSIRYIKEKKSGVLHRSIVSGVCTWEIMMAYSISEFFVLSLQAFLNYAVLHIVFDIQILGSHALLMLLFLLSGYGGVAMGFLLGSICSEEIEAAMLGMATFFPNMLLSGIIWPQEGMDPALQYIVPILPCTMAGESARSITSRGWEFTHPNVYPGFVILVAYIFGYFILTIIFHVLFKR